MEEEGLHVYLCTTGVPVTLGNQKLVLDSLELEFWIANALGTQPSLL